MCTELYSSSAPFWDVWHSPHPEECAPRIVGSADAGPSILACCFFGSGHTSVWHQRSPEKWDTSSVTDVTDVTDVTVTSANLQISTCRDVGMLGCARQVVGRCPGGWWFEEGGWSGWALWTGWMVPMCSNRLNRFQCFCCTGSFAIALRCCIWCIWLLTSMSKGTLRSILEPDSGFVFRRGFVVCCDSWCIWMYFVSSFPDFPTLPPWIATKHVKMIGLVIARSFKILIRSPKVIWLKWSRLVSLVSLLFIIAMLFDEWIKGPDNPTCQILPTSSKRKVKIAWGKQEREKRWWRIGVE